MATNTEPSQIFTFGPFRLDPRERSLSRDGKSVPLTPKLFDTLVALVENSGHVVERNDLIERLWSDTYVEESSLSQNIFQLRKTLGDQDFHKSYIETIPKRGYRFVGDVKQVTKNGKNGTNAFERSGLSQNRVGSIAVLPFRFIGGLDDGIYLGLGIADAIIVKLSSLRQAEVVPTQSVFNLTDNEEDPVEIGKRLNVDTILQGTIQHDAGRIRVTVQLISVPGGKTLWADKFEAAFTDIFAVEDSISEQVAKSLALQITAEGQEQLRKRYTENTEAYQAYFMGLFYWNKRTNDALSKAAEYFREAIALDPQYAVAYAKLADTYFLIAYRDFNENTRNEGFEKSRSTALSALELDPFVAEAHAALGTVKVKYDKNIWAAETSFKRAIAVNPSCAMAYSRYTWFLAAMGRLDESLENMRHAQELDPLSPDANTGLANILYFAGDYDEAVRYCERALELEPDFLDALLWLGLSYQQKGAHDKAIAQFQKAREIHNKSTEPVELLGHAFAVTGQREEAKAILTELNVNGLNGQVRPYNVAMIYAALGNTRRSFEHLEMPYINWTERLRVLRFDPRMTALRTDPRFPQII
jgi:DNA-binding winged helix-turn-helix (wHTH) protein/tetratricopeptide (TPR) repeat protein